MERSEHRKVSQIAEQANLAEDWKALFDQVGPALALALSVGLLEEIASAHVEDIVADCRAETLVLRSELIQEAGVKRRAFARISGVRVGECANFFVGGILEPYVFPEFLEVSVGGDVELCDDGEERALVFPVKGLVACARRVELTRLTYHQ